MDVAYRIHIIHIHYAYTPPKASQSLPPAGGKKFKSLFTATCVWRKNTSQTASVKFCRLRQNYACSKPQTPLAENSEEFLSAKKETPEGVSFCCKYVDRLSYLPARALLASAISRKIPACFLDTTALMTSRVAIIRTTPMIMQITTFCTRPAIRKLTKETAATVTP